MANFPEEILLQIFKLYLETEGQQKLLSCIGKVCKSWNKLCLDCDLWLEVHGAFANQKFKKLCNTGQLINTEELILSEKIDLQDEKNLSEIFSCLPNLISIDFSNVKCVTRHCMTSLGEHCAKLKKVKMSENVNYPEYYVTPEFMKTFLISGGVNLTVLDISYTVISAMKKLLLYVSKYCINLVELLIQSIQYEGQACFPLDAVQNGCPKLRILRTGYPIIFTNHKLDDLSGFPALEVFTHSSIEDPFFSDRDMMNVLSKSTELRVLDIRGCRRVKVDAVLLLSAPHLDSLFISSTSLDLNERLNEILVKWNESLRKLDLSRIKSRFLNDMLVKIVSKGGLPNLEYLDLNNTNVSVSTIVKIIENCENLDTLNLSSCRDVGRGFMRNHCGKRALKALLEKLFNNIPDD